MVGCLDDGDAQAYLALVMSELPLPVQFPAAWIGTWVARRQAPLTEYRKEENRVLRGKVGGMASCAKTSSTTSLDDAPT